MVRPAAYSAITRTYSASREQCLPHIVAAEPLIISTASVVEGTCLGAMLRQLYQLLLRADQRAVAGVVLVGERWVTVEGTSLEMMLHQVHRSCRLLWGGWRVDAGAAMVADRFPASVEEGPRWIYSIHSGLCWGLITVKAGRLEMARRERRVVGNVGGVDMADAVGEAGEVNDGVDAVDAVDVYEGGLEVRDG